jgi:peptidoglycan/LPS O-acetylase OafA/YrhL
MMVDRPASAPVTQRHLALDLVRGLAALCVAIYHWLAWHKAYEIQSLGTFTVYLFFVLSALTMAMVYGQSFEAGLSRDNVGRFFRNRVARLLPLLVIVALAWGALQLRDGSFSFGKALLTATGAFSLASPGLTSNAVGAWTLGIEFGFYLLVPILLLMLPSARTLALLFVGILLAQQAFLLTIAPLENHWTYYIAPLTFAPFFALGLIIYRLGGERTIWFLPATLLCMAAIGGFSLIWQADLFRTPVAHILLMGLCAVTIYAANRSSLPVATRPIAAFLGDISYALYLVHPFTNMIANKLGLGMPAFLIIAIGMAYLTFRFFERPLRDLIRGEFPRTRVGQNMLRPNEH